MDIMKPTLPLAMVLAGALTFSGCATKKYVRTQVDPVETRMAQVEKKTTEHSSTISELENSVSRTDERAQEANKNALAAGQSADRANQAATAAGQRADEAKNLAQQSNTRIGDLQKSVERSIDAIDNFKLVTSESVLFRFNSAELTPGAKEKLDQLAKNVSGMRRYVFEVEGYTDKSGGKQYNLTLSQRRADAVIRYLMTQHNVALRSIHVIGLGSEMPQSAAAAGTKLTPKEARRVEIKLFAPENAGTPMQSRATAPQGQ